MNIRTYHRELIPYDDGSCDFCDACSDEIMPNCNYKIEKISIYADEIPASLYSCILRSQKLPHRIMKLRSRSDGGMFKDDITGIKFKYFYCIELCQKCFEYFYAQHIKRLEELQ